MMRNILTLLSCLLVAQVPTTLANQFAGKSYHACMSEYQASVAGITNIQEACPKLSRLMNCILNGDTYKNVELTEGIVKNMETMVETVLQRYGITCDIDIRSMVKHISHKEPTLQQRCMNQYFKDAAGINTMKDICPILEKGVKCVLDGLDHGLVAMSISSVERLVEQSAAKYGLHCDIDVRHMADKSLAHKSRVPTYRHPTIVDSMPTPGTPYDVASVGQDRAFQHCYHEYSETELALETNNRGAICRNFDQLVTCMMHSGQEMTNQDVQQLQDLHQLIAMKHEHCGVDVSHSSLTGHSGNAASGFSGVTHFQVMVLAAASLRAIWWHLA